jgi:hypothetical protein
LAQTLVRNEQGGKYAQPSDVLSCGPDVGAQDGQVQRLETNKAREGVFSSSQALSLFIRRMVVFNITIPLASAKSYPPSDTHFNTIVTTALSMRG